MAALRGLTVGGVAARLLRDLPSSIPAEVGFVAVSGVAVLGEVTLTQGVGAKVPRPPATVVAGG